MSRGVVIVAVVVAAALAGVLRIATSSSAPPRPLERGVVDIDTNLGYQGGAAAGTGMVLTANGVVLTNNHVIRGATAIRVVEPATRHRYRATVVGYSVARDVAVLKLHGAAGVATIRPGDSARLGRGDSVTAVGNAGGVGGKPSATSGRVTSLGRSIVASDGSGVGERLHGLIETDAQLRPGDSGGALLDSSGRVVGMNTAASSSFHFHFSGGRGFAIPIARALAIERRIMAGRASANVHIGPTPFLGVDIAAGSAVTGPGSTGVVVGGIVPSSPAALAGLSAGDVITSVDGHTVDSANGLASVLLRKRPGGTVRLAWVDPAAGAQAASVRLASGPPQ